MVISTGFFMEWNLSWRIHIHPLMYDRKFKFMTEQHSVGNNYFFRIFQLFTLTLIAVSMAFSWGATGHRIINLKASRDLPQSMSVWKADSLWLEQHAPDPDNPRKDTSGTSFYNEYDRHFINLDSYPNYLSLPHDLQTVISIYGQNTVQNRGTLPWATVMSMDSLIAQLKRGNLTKAETTMADIGHYVGDGHQPLHCTVNYDGPNGAHNGIHSRYETSMISTYQSQLTYVWQQAQYISSPIDYIFGYIDEANGYVDSIFAADADARSVSGWNGNGTPPASYYAALWQRTGGFTTQLFNEAEVATASIWYTAWITAQGIPIPKFTLSVQAENGAVTRNPDQATYDSGSVVQLTATPATGHVFSGWSGDAGGNTNPLTVTMDGNKNITANFIAHDVYVSIQTNPPGLTLVLDGVEYTSSPILTWKYGTTHTIAISSPQDGDPGIRYVWNNWSDGGSSSHVITAFQDSNFVATFTTQYLLTLYSGSGGSAGTIPAGTQWADSGVSLQVNATFDVGYAFSTWKGSGSGSYTGLNNPATITLHEPIFDSALFVASWHTITVMQSLHGNISPGTMEVGNGGTQQFTFTPDSGYAVDSVIVDGAPVDSLGSFTFVALTTDHTLRIVFSQPYHHVMVTDRWNMVSLPYIVDDSRKETIFPQASSPAYAFTDSYITSEALNHGVGYWLKFNRPETVKVTGYDRLSDTIAAHAGWNMIGSLSVPVEVASIASDPPGIITGRVFAYNGSYVYSDTLYPTKGYWVKMRQAGNLYLSAGSTLKNTANRIRIMPSDEAPPPPPDAAIHDRDRIPVSYALAEAYPNPFNPATVISYSLPADGYVSLKVFDMLGREIAVLVDGMEEAGYRSVQWNASNVPTGIYFYRIRTGNFFETKKVVLMK